MLSIIIPSRNEIFLTKTIKDVLEKAKGEIEVIINLDGYWEETIIDDPRVTYIHRGRAVGMRTGINGAVAISKGEYIMKLDAHCLMDEGFDLKLIENYEEKTIVIPRRKRLDAEKWEILDVNKLDVDYETMKPESGQIKGSIDTKRAQERKDILIDETMTFQGSCYFMSREHWDWLDGMNPEGYGEFVREAQEIGLKTWLGGRRVMVNKKTWYAHLHKGKQYGRMYAMSSRRNSDGNAYCDDFWVNNKWKERKHDMQWLIDRFAGTQGAIDKNDIIKARFRNKMDGRCIGGDRVNDFVMMLKDFKCNVGAEIGVEQGVFSEALCKANPDIMLYAIDAWTPYKGYRDHVGKGELDSFHKKTIERLEKYNAKVIKGFSMDIVQDFDDESLDFVYIDSNHDFQNTTNDIIEWSKKVKKGGIIAGHDYCETTRGAQNDVKVVVDAYTMAMGIKDWYVFTGDSASTWMWVKK